ncbi:MAG: NUDIX domain-containing protein [Candidatus Omnitrophica bacterium]|nr:NUDIX domain-containing protein [Candidatus Omnitrophota bacterium]
MDIIEAINFLNKQISNPSKELPKEIFLFVSRITPLVNVDLLIRDEKGRTLLAWRDDKYAGRGWHLPGGIVRFKERLEARIQKVAKEEIGVLVKPDPVPLAINQIICRHRTRGHFISFLYHCFLSSSFVPKNKGLKEKHPGYLKWHKNCPRNLIKAHQIYRKYIIHGK